MRELSETQKISARKYLRNYVEAVQRRFIRDMADVFGLLTFPALKLKFSYSRGDAYIPEDEALIEISTQNATHHCCKPCWKHWVRSRGYVVAHEQAHELHFFTNPILEKEEKGTYEPERFGWSEQGKYLIETFAELSALVFYDKISRLDNSLLLSISYYDYFLPAFKLFSDNRRNAEGLLKKLAQMNVKEASPIINPYKHFLSSPRISKELCFGVCVKSADLDRVA